MESFCILNCGWMWVGDFFFLSCLRGCLTFWFDKLKLKQSLSNYNEMGRIRDSVKVDDLWIGPKLPDVLNFILIKRWKLNTTKKLRYLKPSQKIIWISNWRVFQHKTESKKFFISKPTSKVFGFQVFFNILN